MNIQLRVLNCPLRLVACLQLSAFTQGCFVIPDVDCISAADCRAGRICDEGECREPSTEDLADEVNNNQTGAGSTGTSKTHTGCLAVWAASSKKCSIPESYREAVIDDCERRRTAQPDACLDEFEDGLACESSTSAWSCSDTGQAELTGCTEQLETHEVCLKEETASKCPRYTAATAVAGIEEAWGEAVKVQLSVAFYPGGAIRMLDGQACRESSADTEPNDMAGWMSCWEPYDCAGCELWLGYYEGSDELEESWYLIRPRGAAGAAACDAYSAFYRILDPGQASSDVGIDAPPMLAGESSACDDCLATCSGIQGCCTGSGCICQAACAPTGCQSPARLCCGSFGDCFCTPNCPY